MKMRRIDLDENELPATVLVELSLREVVILAKSLGPTSPAARDALVPGFGDVGANVFACLEGLCNQFFENGLYEAWGAIT